MLNKKYSFLILLITVFISNLVFSQITEIGLASFYADKFDGRITASGAIFDQNKMTAAHRTLPFGTKVKVTNLENSKSVEVSINDRGPFVNDRVIDLSRAAATELDFVRKGVTKVKVEVLNLAKSSKSNTSASSVITTTPKEKPKKKKNNTATIAAAASTASSSISSEAISYFRVDSDLITPKGYGIQVASYQEAANLMLLCNNIKQEVDKDVLVQVGESNGKKVYRVIIGAFSNKEQAEKYKKGLGHKYSDSFILAF